MSRTKAQQKRMVDQARKNLLDAVERNLAGLEAALSCEDPPERNAKCVKDECEVERRCIEVFREAACVFIDSKGAFQSRRLASLRVRIDDALKENRGHFVPETGK